MVEQESKKTEQAPEAEPPAESVQAPGPRPIEVTDKARQQAESFFKRSAKIASGGNHEYAVQMYLEGLRRNPDALEAHQALLDQALRRQAAGGKKAGLIATLKLKIAGKASAASLLGKGGSKNAVDELLQAESVWAKDPQNLGLAGIVLQKMIAAGCLESAKWLASWLAEFNARTVKDGRRFSMLADAFAQLGQTDKAVDACRAAAAVTPEDGQLAEKLKNMLATQAMRKGKYDDQEGFRKSLKEGETQDMLREKEAIVQRQSAADQRIAQAREELERAPNETGKIIGLVDALLLKDTPESEVEAVQVLTEAHQRTGAYRFKQRAGEIRMRANRRQARQMRARLEADPDNAQLDEQYKQMLKEHLEQELTHFQDSAKNYPTDMRLRYEIGRRFLQLGRYDEAIPALQEGQRDPKNHLQAMSLLGQCFYRKKWYSDAIDVYKRSLETPDAASTDIGKELQYYLGRAYEGDNKPELAKEAYSAVAQIDFLYKDVRKRLERLRADKKDQANSQ